MRLSDLIAASPPDFVEDLVFRIVPGAAEVEPGLRAHRLELMLSKMGVVEQAVLARRPPVLSLLLQLLTAEGYVADLKALRDRAEHETAAWSREVSDGDLANRVPDRALIYRRMLEAAWANDLVLDPSEIRILGLLREELGLLRAEHFLLAYHDSIRIFWESDDPVTTAVNALRRDGIVYEIERGIALPEELVPHVRRALGVELSRDSARRLYERLDSGTHLKAALSDHDLPTSGSKQSRIERLVASFVPAHRVVDTMHIRDARHLARELELQVSGAKEDLVSRIVDHFAAGDDLRETPPEPSELPPEREPRVLVEAEFRGLFLTLKGHQLQRILMDSGLRHAGSKDKRVSTLWTCHLSEASLLSRLKNQELADLLRRAGLDAKGAKPIRIERYVSSFRGTRPYQGATGDPLSSRAEDAPASPILRRLAELVRGVELSSKSPSRFADVQAFLSSAIGIEPDALKVKYLGEAKNYRNRVGEALRSYPLVLVLLSEAGSGGLVLEAARSRLAVSPGTHFVAITGEQTWTCEGIMCATRSPTLRQLATCFPGAEVHLSGLPPAAEWERAMALKGRLEARMSADWVRGDMREEERVREALALSLDSPDDLIRTKHVSEAKNVGNRVSEALGAGCSALILVVPDTLAARAREEAERQLAASRQPTVVVLLAESERGGYEPPVVVTGAARDQHRGSDGPS